MAKQKNKLECTKKVVISVDEHNLSTFIRNEFNQPSFEFVADWEANNDSEYSINVHKEELDNEQIKEVLDFVRHNKGDRITGLLLQQLCVEGKIDEGEYLIQVCW